MHLRDIYILIVCRTFEQENQFAYRYSAVYQKVVNIAHFELRVSTISSHPIRSIYLIQRW